MEYSPSSDASAQNHWRWTLTLVLPPKDDEVLEAGSGTEAAE